MILVGIVEGVGGLGVMKEAGVFGGSMFVITFLHESMKVESVDGVAGTSVDNARTLNRLEITGRERMRVACRSIVGAGGGRA